MTALVFTVQADADTVSAAMDSRTGPYPKAGVDVGGGVHAPAVAARTVRFGDVVKHPTLNQWRFTLDATVQTEIGKGMPIPASGSQQALDGTWFPNGR